MKTIITIARQYGSGGREVGQKLAEYFNIPFYDKELIALAAKETGMNEEMFEKADERASSSLLYSLMIGNYTFGSHISPINDMPINDMLFLIQTDIIKKLAKAGPCVIVGRCADYVLRDDKSTFNVFIHTDKLSRMDRIVQEYKVEPEKAADYLVKKDKQRANYYNFYTNKKWGDLENYHLTLNSAATSIDGAVELIKTAVAMKEAMQK